MLYLKEDFEKLYKLYYPKMFAFAKNYVPANEDAENIVHDVFLTLWERKEEIEISFTLTTYLFTLVKNRCLNFLRHKLIEEEYKSLSKYILNEDEFSLYLKKICNKLMKYRNYISIINRVTSLDEEVLHLFIKSRIEGLKYKEISDELGISVNTVENQMVTALKKLRVALKDYLPLLLFLVN